MLSLGRRLLSFSPFGLVLVSVGHCLFFALAFGGGLALCVLSRFFTFKILDVIAALGSHMISKKA